MNISNFNADAVKHLISINILVYTATFVFSQYKIESVLSLYHPLDDRFELYQIFTHMFVHSKRIFLHIIFNMLALFMFGWKIETLLGIKKFMIIYFLSGILAALLQIVFNTGILYYFVHTLDFSKAKKIFDYLNQEQRINLYSSMYSPMMGSSGAVSGIVGAFARYFPEHKIFILPFPFPIAVRKAIFIFIFGSFLSVIFNLSPGVAHFAHIGGILSGYFIGNFFLKKEKNIF
ncbi:MAG: rhomboid family intramembrane serine protease [Flavobacteriales bacterium]|uniref:rhomboid family intramembrane serine protease n=1 Tax=Blattabacterium sp. (Mastotermes darwiniensis) TaxID=39768 RepID=UPI000231DE10|nr:rhomboid family intramembrane serine protease [Blattabacterium sp. (Mastotermes darwiniensis)]AER40580.1 rhomboid family protein [Blattabacterium sp. (Mastotermes darwiniensis) str. MADAR]MDR1805077.1 rhomboid family intramembrane serine protease [Flavobacteriales bacterium]